MQIFVNLITRAIFMSTPLVLGALGEVLAERTRSQIVQVIGKKIVLYKQAPDKKNRKIELPR